MAIRSTDSIIFIGCKGCGKTTHGKLLAEKWGVDFLDVDEIILQTTGISARELYIKKGASGFMQVEEEVCKRIAEKYADKKVVISTGSGICDNAPAINELSSLGCFVFLKYDINSSVEKIFSKVFQKDDGSFANLPSYVAIRKPKKIADVQNYIRERFENRYAQYEGIADLSILLKEECPKDENFNSILQAL